VAAPRHTASANNASAFCENRIKELKYDFAAGSLCMREVWATEAALNVVMLAFNLMSLFRQVMLKTTKHHTLATLRYKLFAQAGYITHEGRQRSLKLATAMRKRKWFTRTVDAIPTLQSVRGLHPYFRASTRTLISG
jgi:hypothetical protein